MATMQTTSLFPDNVRLFPAIIAVLLPVLLLVSARLFPRAPSRLSTEFAQLAKKRVAKDYFGADSLPRVPSVLPIVGHALHLQRYSADYVHRLISKATEPLFTISVLNKSIIVANPSTERFFARHVSDTGLAQILAIVGKSVFGLTDASIKCIVALDPRAQHREEFLSTSSLRDLSEASSNYAQEQINSQPSVQDVILGKWLFQLGVSSTACAVWGEANPWHMDQEFAEQFGILAECFDTLGRPFPKLTARRAYNAREFLLARLQEFHAEHRESRTRSAAHRINAIAMSDPNWEDNPDYFRVELLSSVGLLVTASTLIVWMIWHLLAEPAMLHEIVAEVRALVTVDGRPDLRDVRATCPRLTAAWHETLRLHMTAVPRLARHDFEVEAHLSTPLALATGDILLLPMYAFNRDAETWGPTVHHFDPGRFFDARGNLSSGALRRVKGFGVAGNLCPGRTFGADTAMAIVVGLLRKYNMESVDGAGFRHPTVMKGLHVGFQRYEGDVSVRLTEAPAIAD